MPERSLLGPNPDRKRGTIKGLTRLPGSSSRQASHHAFDIAASLLAARPNGVSKQKSNDGDGFLSSSVLRAFQIDRADSWTLRAHSAA